MWRNFSSNFAARKQWMAIVLPLWVLGSFVIVQLVIQWLFFGVLRSVSVYFEASSPAVFHTVLSALVYILTIAMVIGLPWLVKQYKTSRTEIGLDRDPTWLDLILAPAGFVGYIILSGALMALATHFLTFIDFNQTQDTGFSTLSHPYEYVLAFLTLVIIAPVSEEVLFRGYLFGKLRSHVPTWVAILLTSGLFAFAHGSWNVGIDVFALSIVLCLLRVATKSLWPSIMLHMIKNGLAFYLLFINPTLLSTLGG